MVTVRYPPDKATEMAKKYIEVMQKFPFDPSIGKPLVTAGVSSDKDGMKVISIGEVEKGKYKEALNRTARRLVEYYGIERYRYEVETLLTVEEAMPLLGLAPP